MQTLPSFSLGQTVFDGRRGVGRVEFVQKLHQGHVFSGQGGRFSQLLYDVMLQLSVGRELGQLPHRHPHIQTLTSTGVHRSEGVQQAGAKYSGQRVRVYQSKEGGVGWGGGPGWYCGGVTLFRSLLLSNT